MTEYRIRLAALARDKRGITALEYGIVAGWLALVVILGFMHIGSSLSGVFSSVGSGL
jgi:pilus assembly protein Flp/PilA